MTGIFVLTAVLLVALLLYLAILARRAVALWFPRAGRPASRAIAAGSVAGVVAMCLLILPTAAIVVLYFALSSMALDAARLILRHFVKSPAWLAKMWQSGLAALVIAALLTVAGAINARDVREARYEIYTDKPLREEGYRVALISDLHFGTGMDLEKLRACVKRIEESQPDLVALAGDIVDEGTTGEEMRAVLEILGGMEAEFGVFFVYGNHDRASYSRHPHFSEEELRAALEKSGVQVLEDEQIVLNSEFAICGRLDASFSRRAGERAATSDLLKERRGFQLLLDHQPVGFRENAEAGVDLQLSGHTHYGQIWPLGLFLKPLGFAESAYGLSSEGNLRVVVSSGLGAWGAPIRTQGSCEYGIIDILPNPR